MKNVLIILALMMPITTLANDVCRYADKRSCTDLLNYSITVHRQTNPELVCGLGNVACATLNRTQQTCDIYVPRGPGVYVERRVVRALENGCRGWQQSDLNPNVWLPYVVVAG